MASIFTPRLGTAHEWMTSLDVEITRISMFVGRTARWSTSRRRNIPGCSSSVGIIYESKARIFESEYSYAQYHWCPMALRVTRGSATSSMK